MYDIGGNWTVKWRETTRGGISPLSLLLFLYLFGYKKYSASSRDFLRLFVSKWIQKSMISSRWTARPVYHICSNEGKSCIKIPVFKQNMTKDGGQNPKNDWDPAIQIRGSMMLGAGGRCPYCDISLPRELGWTRKQVSAWWSWIHLNSISRRRAMKVLPYPTYECSFHVRYFCIHLETKIFHWFSIK